MSDQSTMTIRATFAARDEAERAVEHLVQEHGIARADVFVRSTQSENSAGERVSGGDAATEPAEGSAFPPALRGTIEVSADVAQGDLERVREAFHELGALEIGSA